MPRKYEPDACDVGISCPQSIVLEDGPRVKRFHHNLSVSGGMCTRVLPLIEGGTSCRLVGIKVRERLF